MRMPFLAVLLLLPALAQAQTYRWVDERGEVHYSDRVPLSGAKNVQQRSLPTAQGASALPYALQQAVKNFPVALYTSPACKDSCAQARALLDKRGVPYQENSVTDEADIAQLKQLSGASMVPVMTVGRETYKGFESGIYQTALDNAGYPSSSRLPPGVTARQLVAKPVRSDASAAADGKPAASQQESVDAAAPK